MGKIVGMGLVVVLALGIGSYALGHGSSADGQSTASAGQMMSSGGMMGGSGMMGMGRSMMNGVTSFIDMCRTMMAGWFGPGGNPAGGDPYSHRERGAQRTERGIQ